MSSPKLRKLARAILLNLAVDRNAPVTPDHPFWAWAIEQAKRLDDALIKYNLNRIPKP